MDGASRFTQRDAMASILITGINIVAGFLIGVFQHGMDLRRALETYTILTIGDGLVTVIPALMISVAGGLIITRANSENALGTEFQKQMFGNPEPLLLSGGVLIALSAFPGLPTIPFLILGGGLGAFAWKLREKVNRQEAATASTAALASPAKENFDAFLRVDPLAIEVGLGLAYLAEGGSESPLLRKIAAIRKNFASTVGFVLPPVRVTDNMSLRGREYQFLIKGGEADRFDLMPGFELAIPTPNAKPLDGQTTREPAFGLQATWVSAERADLARTSGYTVVDCLNVLGTHFTELVRRNAHEIFSRQDAKSFCDRVAVESAKVVEDLVPKLLSYATIQRVLQNLLRENVPIRDGLSILEALGEGAVSSRNPILLTEYVRISIRRGLLKPYLAAGGELRCWYLDAALDHMIETSVQHGEQNSALILSPDAVRDVIRRVQSKIDRPEIPAVILAGGGSRYFLRQMLEPVLWNAAVVSHNEIPPGVKVVSLGTIQ